MNPRRSRLTDTGLYVDYRGGAVSGMSTLLGFLAAIFFKTLE